MSNEEPLSAKLPTRKYKRAEITVEYQPRRCTHAGECLRGAPAVFNTWELPWVQVENGTVEEIVEAIERCPTGALHYVRTDGGVQEQIPATNVVSVARNGPYYVRGDLEIVMPDGAVLQETRAALCRCGVSGSKPFCDNAHREVGFREAGLHAPDATASAKALTGQKLRITVNKNANYKFEGAFELRDAAGKVIVHRQKDWLCRCGNSGNKPFCDSTHKLVEFKSGEDDNG